MKTIVKNIIRFLVVGSVTLVMAACYGVYMLYNKKVIARDSSGNAIEGLRVSVTDESGNVITEKMTSPNGEAILDADYPLMGMNAKVIDIDGDANGGDFGEHTIILDDEDSQTVILD